jgi:endo-1,4-beta-xylanase
MAGATAAWHVLLDRAARGSAAAIESLRIVASARGLHFGAAAENNMPGLPRAYQELFLQQCELFSADLSWASTGPTPGAVDLSRVDPTLSFAFNHGLRLTGSHLLWYEAFPSWFGHAGNRDRINEVVVEHVTQMVSTFRGRTFSWNVVNEAIEPREGRSDGLRVRGLFDRIDLSAIILAFRAAKDADPQALLTYNDYGLESDTAEQQARRDTLLRLLDTFARNNTPIGAIGLQSHLILGDDQPFNEVKYRKFLSNISSRGLKIIISELDVLEPASQHSTLDTDRAVADLYTRFLSTALDERAVTAVVVWALSDRYSWLRERKRRALRPLPFDENFRPKPAFYAILDALRHAPSRPP